LSRQADSFLKDGKKRKQVGKNQKIEEFVKNRWIEVEKEFNANVPRIGEIVQEAVTFGRIREKASMLIENAEPADVEDLKSELEAIVEPFVRRRARSWTVESR
jgi:hypothetical protein